MKDHKIKQDLVDAYRIIAFLQMDDLTYTHITTRPESSDYFYILEFGKMFCEATIADLIKVDLDGNILEGQEKYYNKTGYIIHSYIYKNRSDINAIFHLHTPDSIAVSMMKCGLLPISQFSMPFFENISYHEYSSLALDAEQNGGKISQDLADKKTMLLRSHGTITCGANLQEAFFYTRFLEQACKIQVKILSSNAEYVAPSREICIRARDDMLSFEKELGSRDWQALLRKINNNL